MPTQASDSSCIAFQVSPQDKREPRENVLALSDISPRDKTWDKHRANADIVSNYYAGPKEGQLRLAKAIEIETTRRLKAIQLCKKTEQMVSPCPPIRLRMRELQRKPIILLTRSFKAKQYIAVGVTLVMNDINGFAPSTKSR